MTYDDIVEITVYLVDGCIETDSRRTLFAKAFDSVSPCMTMLYVSALGDPDMMRSWMLGHLLNDGFWPFIPVPGAESFDPSRHLDLVILRLRGLVNATVENYSTPSMIQLSHFESMVTTLLASDRGRY